MRAILLSADDTRQGQEVRDPELLAARRRVDARRLEAGADAAADPPSRSLSACRSILRRCPNAASMSPNVAARSASVPGSSGARSNATRIESTFGTGQNTCRLTVPAVLQRPYQAAFALGEP